MNLAILIPAYQPDEKLTELVYKLAAMGFPILLIVNDGSGRECREVFEKCGLVPGCSVLPLKQNMGKGFALKTGMRRILDIDPHIAGCITVDADGQHLAEDIGRIREAFCENPSSLILGCRDFDEEQVPFKSRFGNRITRSLFRVITKKRVRIPRRDCGRFLHMLCGDLSSWRGTVMSMRWGCWWRQLR